jgi:hypothetical protein
MQKSAKLIKSSTKLIFELNRAEEFLQEMEA